MTREGFSARRRQDGSIDTDFYSSRARVLRKAEFKALLAGFWRSLITWWSVSPSRSSSEASQLKPSHNRS